MATQSICLTSTHFSRRTGSSGWRGFSFLRFSAHGTGPRSCGCRRIAARLPKHLGIPCSQIFVGQEWIDLDMATQISGARLDKASAIPSQMRAVVYRGINDMRVETVPVPRIGPGELLIRVATCGICGTDLKKIHLGSHSAPRI